MSPASVLRQRLDQSEIIVIPGGGSPIELRQIQEAGFDAGYVSGYATAAARFGEPDIGLIAYADIAEAVLAIRRVTTIPLIVDCDTGYGDIAKGILSGSPEAAYLAMQTHLQHSAQQILSSPALNKNTSIT